MKKVIFVFLIVFSACNAPKTTLNETNSYEIVFQKTIDGKKEKNHQIITNYDEFNALITELKLPEEDYETLLKIDLENHNLLAVFMGEKNTGGYDLAIDKVDWTPTTAIVNVKEIVPGKNDMVTMVITSPYLFLTLPKNKQIEVKY